VTADEEKEAAEAAAAAAALKIEQDKAAALATAEAIAEANAAKAIQAIQKRAAAEQAAADAAVAGYTEADAALKGYTDALKRQLEAQIAVAKASEDPDKVTNILKAEAALKSFNVTQEETAKSAEKAKTAQDSFGTALEGTIRTMTGMTSGNETLIGSWLNMGKASKKLQKEIDALKEDLLEPGISAEDTAKKTQELTSKQEQQEKSTGSLKDKVKEYVKNINPVASIISNIQQATIGMAIANDVATAAFNASSGAAGAYDNELVTLQLSNRANGISTAEMGESYGALMGNLSGFGVMAESERMRLGELGAEFAKVGVSGADFAGTLQTMTMGFGMSTTAATGMQKEAMALAQTLGKDVGQVMSEMNAALPQLASYGDDAVDMFFDLEKQAQRTGLAVGDLIGIAGNYKTFDSAAEAAGNLNAVLGTQLFSTMGLLEAQLEGPEAVIAYMSENLSDSIGDWDSLNTFQKDAVANAAGMNVEQMNHLMNQKNMTKEEKDRAKTMDETMAAGLSLWQQLTIFAQNFAIAVTPLVNFLVGGLKKVNAGFAYMREEMGFLATIAKVVASAYAFTFGAKAVAGMASFYQMLKRINVVEKIALGIAQAKSAAGAAWRGMTGIGLVGVAAGMAAAVGVYATLSAMTDSHAKGTDSTSGRMALVGEEGPEGYVSPDGKKGGIVGANGPEIQTNMPQGASIINNTTMTALAKQAGNGDAAGAAQKEAMTGLAKQSATGAAQKEAMTEGLAKQSANAVAQREAMTEGLTKQSANAVAQKEAMTGGLAKQSAAGAAQNTAMTNLVKNSDGSGLRTKAPQSENIINNTGMTALASQATNRSVAATTNGAAMAAAVSSLKGEMSKMSNRPIEITTNPVMLRDDLGRGVNDHFGEHGTQPIRLRS
jgi:hypothetical protein